MSSTQLRGSLETYAQGLDQGQLRDYQSVAAIVSTRDTGLPSSLPHCHNIVLPVISRPVFSPKFNVQGCLANLSSDQVSFRQCWTTSSRRFALYQSCFFPDIRDLDFHYILIQEQKIPEITVRITTIICFLLVCPWWKD